MKEVFKEVFAEMNACTSTSYWWNSASFKVHYIVDEYERVFLNTLNDAIEDLFE